MTTTFTFTDRKKRTPSYTASFEGSLTLKYDGLWVNGVVEDHLVAYYSHVEDGWMIRPWHGEVLGPWSDIIIDTEGT